MTPPGALAAYPDPVFYPDLRARPGARPGRRRLWRAVDQEGVVLDILVQSRRNKQAAIRFLQGLLMEMRSIPQIIVTDKLKSYGAAIKELKLEVDHRQRKGLNNRAENSHQFRLSAQDRQRRDASARAKLRFR